MFSDPNWGWIYLKNKQKGEGLTPGDHSLLLDGGGGMALQTSACSEIRSPQRQDGGRGRREVSRGDQLRLRRKNISDRRGLEAETHQTHRTKKTREEGPGLLAPRHGGGGCSKSVGRTVAAPVASRPAGAHLSGRC